MATLTLDLSTSRVKIADTLSSANFGFDDLRDRMNKFTLRFDAFIERERKRILDERNKFRMDVAEVQGMTIFSIKITERF
jgi:kinetochore protein Spc25, fungi type